MILTTPTIIRGITAFAKQAAARTLYTTQITMAPIKVTYLYKVYFYHVYYVNCRICLHCGGCRLGTLYRQWICLKILRQIKSMLRNYHPMGKL